MQEAMTTTSANQVAKRSAPIDGIRAALAKVQKDFELALPETVKKYLTPERLTKITLSAISRSPQLLECTPQSILKSVMEAATLGLEPSGGVLGHAYLVAYRNNKNGTREAQLIVGYRGLIDLARRGGQIKSVSAHVVYERDEFDLCYGLDERLTHKPSMADERGEIIAAYCVANFVDGSKHVEVMTAREIDDIRKRSRSRDNGPWSTDYAEMARKTVVRRAAKYWPLSTEMTRALDIEDAAERGESVEPSNVIDMPFEEAKEAAPQTKRIADKVKSKQAKQDAADNKDEPPHDPETGEVFDYVPPPMSDEELAALEGNK